MASSFTQHPAGTDPAPVVTDAMIAIDHELTHVPVKSAMDMIAFRRNRLAATTLVTIADGTPLPRSVFDELICEADIIGHILSGNGELLWQSRKKRLATPAQINGLIARDGGCVLCQAHHSKCVAHHLLPWEAPGKGETNIENLAFVCGDCHTRVLLRASLINQ